LLLGCPPYPDLVRSVLKFAGASPSGFLELNSLICMGDSDTRDEITEAVVNTLDRSAPQAAYNTLLTTIDSAFAAGTFGLARLLQTIGFERYPSQFVMWVPLSLLGKGRKALNAPVSIQWGNGAQKYTLYGRIVGSSHSAPGLGYTSAQLKQQAKLQNGNTKGKLVLIQGIGERPASPRRAARDRSARAGCRQAHCSEAHARRHPSRAGDHPPVVDPSAQRPGESDEDYLERLVDLMGEAEAEDEDPSAPAPAPASEEFDEAELERKIAERKQHAQQSAQRQQRLRDSRRLRAEAPGAYHWWRN
jgi:hypothetical protein